MKTLTPPTNLSQSSVAPRSTSEIIHSYQKNIIPNYGRVPIALVRGKGSYVWNAEGKRYLDFSSGIAVNTLGHCHPAITKAITRQAKRLVHTSNIFYTEGQEVVAERIIREIGAGKSFFCNSGAEANEALFKFARKFGHDSGRFEILTTLQSFHGRTMAGISATGQDKVKKGFEPLVEGFRHVPYNDLEAMRQAIGKKTVAILIEGIQGEGGIIPAHASYLLGLRKLCDEQGLLLLMDAVQCGMYRTGQFQSYQRILGEQTKSFLPDGISMAKGIAGGLPMGAIWIRQPYQDLLGVGSHGSTFGGNPLVCAAAMAVFKTIEKENLAENASQQGTWLKTALQELKSPFVEEIRGLGLMIGIELKKEIPLLQAPDKPPAALFVRKLHEKGLITVVAGTHTIRFLPPLNITQNQSAEAIKKMKQALQELH
ncbi:MAG: aspartate aminotransferase family protein [Verrucomicrobiota bacterium]